MFWRQLMMQMAQMRDAKLARLEDEHRIAEIFRAAAPIANIGLHIADAQIGDAHIMLHSPSRRIPATQHMCNTRIRMQSEMRRMRLVHRHRIKRHGHVDMIIIIGRRSHTGHGLDQKGRVPFKSHPRHILRQSHRPDERMALRHETRTGLWLRCRGERRPEQAESKSCKGRPARQHGNLAIGNPNRYSGATRAVMPITFLQRADQSHDRLPFRPARHQTGP